MWLWPLSTRLEACWPAQVAQARTILSHMAALQREAGRPSWAMLAGDFNSVPGSAIYRSGGSRHTLFCW